ncbi:MAG: hypothetical protein ACRDOI_33715 [Trebonia sp.]
MFGISEVNWGITPGNLVTRKLAEVMPARDAMFYIMTGESFDGRKAAELGWSPRPYRGSNCVPASPRSPSSSPR